MVNTAHPTLGPSDRQEVGSPLQGGLGELWFAGSRGQCGQTICDSRRAVGHVGGRLEVVRA